MFGFICLQVKTIKIYDNPNNHTHNVINGRNLRTTVMSSARNPISTSNNIRTVVGTRSLDSKGFLKVTTPHTSLFTTNNNNSSCASPSSSSSISSTSCINSHIMKEEPFFEDDNPTTSTKELRLTGKLHHSCTVSNYFNL